MPGHCAQQLRFVPALEDWGVYVMTSHLMMLQSMTRQLITSSSGFKEKNGCCCHGRARTDMKDTNEIVYHCHSSCETFAQFDVRF